MSFCRKTIEIILIFTLLLWGSVAVAAADSADIGPEQFEGKKIGVVSSSNFVDNVYHMIDNPEVCYYQNVYDMFLALSTGKVDAIAANEAAIRFNMQENKELDYFVADSEYKERLAVMFPQTNLGRKYEKEFNYFLKNLKEDGTFDALQRKWFDGEGDQSMLDYKTLPSKNGTVTVAANPSYAPFEFIRDGEIVGYETELVALFCEEYGYGMKVENVEYDGIVAGVASAEFDMGIAGTNITEENNEHVIFSEPVLECPLTAAYLVPAKENTDYFKGKKVAIQADTFYVDAVYDMIPSPDVTYYLTPKEMLDAVVAGEVDCCLMDNLISEFYLPQYDGLDFINLETKNNIGFIATKNEAGKALIVDFNQFLKSLEESGKLEKLQEKWIHGSDSDRTMSVDYNSLIAENGTITYAVCPTYPPFEYEQDGSVIGYEVELVALFCREKGYELNMEKVDFPSVLAGVSSEKYNFGSSTLTILNERSDKVYFSNPVYHCSSYLLYKSDKAETGGFFENLKARFHKTFIEESRLMLFFDGIFVTVLITLLSIVAGAVIGFLTYLAYRQNYKAVIKISNLIKWIVQGMPEVVLLMILFYVVFAGTELSALFVAVIGFTLIFACSVLTLLQSGESSVDVGQMIAAKALGYSDSMTFFKIILPQSACQFLPSLQNEVVSIIKGTAIVGYISVVDVTKVADIIRGSTYDALLPLLAVAIVYVVLTYLVRLILQKIEKKVDPKTRTEGMITKGFVIK